jgi:para-nitrobenzyl esterase
MALSALLLAVFVAAGAASETLVRQVACGRVRGTWLTPSSPAGLDQRVAVWRGLPYGAPPVGNLRWRAPEPAACWKGVYDDMFELSACVQASNPDQGIEDCLYLTVHVPEKVANGSVTGVPVLFYIHGGSLIIGSGQWEQVRALSVRLNAVVVTINYRPQCSSSP